VRRLLLSLALAAVWVAPARAETIYPGHVSDARLAVAPDGTPSIGYLVGPNLVVTRRVGGGWPETGVGFPRTNLELDGFAARSNGDVVALVRARDGSWLGMWDGERRVSFRRDSPRALFGPAGLALDGHGRAVVAYALWFPSQKTYLRLAREDARGRITTTPITRGGFPSTATLAAAAPVVLPSGKVRVVETYKPVAIDWRPIPGDWLGQFLHSSALGIPTGRVGAAANRSVVFAAWTEAFPTLGPPAVVLAVHASRTFSGVALENAVFADLVVTRTGAELAANRCVADGVCEALVDRHELDGVVAGYAAETGGGRQVLLDRPGGLEWYRSPTRLSVSVSLNVANGQLSGRVTGATGGSVTISRELAGGARGEIATVPVAADGSFTASDQTLGPVAPVAYRAVYVDPASGVPFAALVSTGAGRIPQLVDAPRP